MKSQGLLYFENVLVATFLCLNVSFLSAAGAPVSPPGLLKDPPTTFHVESFGKNLTVNGRQVTCSGEVKDSYYPSPMYTCNQISVDGEKLYHGYATSSSRPNVDCNSGCPCGNNRGRPNDIRALCTAMLKAHNVSESLVAAYVVKPFCTAEIKMEKRVKIFYNEKNELEWEDVVAPNGYINILQCLTAKS